MVFGVYFAFSRDGQTKHLFYLQLRHDLLDGSLPVTDELAIALGSLAMRAEYGDWRERAAQADVRHYLAPSVIRSMGENGARTALLSQYSRYNEMPDVKAELLLMQVRQIYVQAECFSIKGQLKTVQFF